MLEVGRKVNIPANTEFEDTYQYRWIQTFMTRLDEWQLDDELGKHLIREIVEYAKDNDLLDRGAAILNNPLLLEICKERMENKESAVQSEIKRLCSGMMLIGQYDLQTRLQILMENENGMANITRWFLSGKLSLGFMSVSTSCLRAIHRLTKMDPMQAEELPSLPKLLLTRQKILSMPVIAKAVRQVLKDEMVRVES